MSKQVKRQKKESEVGQPKGCPPKHPLTGYHSKAVLAATQPTYGSLRSSVISAAVRLTSHVRYLMICLRYASAFRIGLPLAQVSLPSLSASQNSAQLLGPFTAFSSLTYVFNHLPAPFFFTSTSHSLASFLSLNTFVHTNSITPYLLVLLLAPLLCSFNLLAMSFVIPV